MNSICRGTTVTTDVGCDATSNVYNKKNIVIAGTYIRYVLSNLETNLVVYVNGTM